MRAAHSAVFQYLDDTGTTVSALAERAQMTKQAMAELVHQPRGATATSAGYRTRPTGGAKLVLATERGREVLAIARALVPEIEERVGAVVGAERVPSLVADLDAIRAALTDGGSSRTSAAARSATSAARGRR